MAQLVIQAAGAAIGSMIAPGIGASIGFSHGSFIVPVESQEQGNAKDHTAHDYFELVDTSGVGTGRS